MASVMPLVLVVEEDARMRRFLIAALASHGFRSVHAEARAAALARGARHNPDIVLLDARAGRSGVEVTARLRRWTRAPILVIASRDGEDEKIAVLDAGANDFLVEPFGTGEMLARMRVWLRHAAPRAQPSPRAPARTALRIDAPRRRLFVEEREVHLTPTEHRILSELARSRGVAVPAERLAAAIWQENGARHLHSLRAHVAQLRSKVERDPS